MRIANIIIESKELIRHELRLSIFNYQAVVRRTGEGFLNRAFRPTENR